MNYLFLINETFTNGYIFNTLDIISLSAILSGIFVIISKNPIISVLFLISLFASISLYLIVLGLAFIGLAYLIVYIGAVSILFLFILMLINIRISELQSETSNSIVLCIIIAILFNYPMFQLLPYDLAILGGTSSSFKSYINYILYNLNLNKEGASTYQLYRSSASSSDYTAKAPSSMAQAFNNDIFFVTSKMWDGNLAESSHMTTIGNVMYTNYNIWLIIASFILLLAMVGAIVITIKPKN